MKKIYVLGLILTISYYTNSDTMQRGFDRSQEIPTDAFGDPLDNRAIIPCTLPVHVEYSFPKQRITAELVLLTSERLQAEHKEELERLTLLQMSERRTTYENRNHYCQTNYVQFMQAIERIQVQQYTRLRQQHAQERKNLEGIIEKRKR